MANEDYSDTQAKLSGITGPPTLSDRFFKDCCNSAILASRFCRCGDQSAGQAVRNCSTSASIWSTIECSPRIDEKTVSLSFSGRRSTIRMTYHNKRSCPWHPPWCGPIVSCNSKRKHAYRHKSKIIKLYNKTSTQQVKLGLVGRCRLWLADTI